MSKVFICAGHGGSDPGAVSGSRIERDIAIGLVDGAVALLAGQNKMGREIVKVPHDLKLAEGVAWINRTSTDHRHDLCIEVHLNSNAGTPGTGTETYFGLPQLANEVHQEIVKVLGLRDRGVKDGNRFYFNNYTVPASCLVEMGFINNPTDAQRVVAVGSLALAKGILRACGGTWHEKTTEPPVAPPVPPTTPNPPVTTPPVVVVIPEEIKANSGWITKVRLAIRAFFLAWETLTKTFKE